MSEKLSSALTVGEIARLTNEPIHRIEYLIRSRNIQPVQRAGNLRVFSADDLAILKKEIKQINLRKGERHE
jgi:DNA-binding transcriptional MerR regulator